MKHEMRERAEGKGWRIITHEDGSRQCVPNGGLPSDGHAWEIRHGATCPVCEVPIGEKPFHKVLKGARDPGFRGPQLYHVGCEFYL